MNAELVHALAFFLSSFSQENDTLRQAPHLPFLAEYFKDSIAEDEQTCSSGKVTRLRRKFRLAKHPHHWSFRREHQWSRLAWKQHNGRMMPAPGPSERAASRMIDAVPDSEIFIAVLLPAERLVELDEHLIRPPHVDTGQRSRPDYVS